MLSEHHDLSIRETLDAAGLTRWLLDHEQWRDRGFNPVIQPEVTPVTDSLLLSHDILLYHCGPAVQPSTLNVRAWVWRYSLHLTVLGRDPEHVASLCAWLDKRIAAWPYRDPSAYGRVTRILDNTGFESDSTGDMTSSKSVVAWHATKRIQASSPTGTTR